MSQRRRCGVGTFVGHRRVRVKLGMKFPKYPSPLRHPLYKHTEKFQGSKLFHFFFLSSPYHFLFSFFFFVFLFSRSFQASRKNRYVESNSFNDWFSKAFDLFLVLSGLDLGNWNSAVSRDPFPLTWCIDKSHFGKLKRTRRGIR